MTFKQKREYLRKTQKQLAPLLGVSEKSIKNYEQEIRKPISAVIILLDQLIKEEEKRQKRGKKNDL